jgi:hypothetical protein
MKLILHIDSLEEDGILAIRTAKALIKSEEAGEQSGRSLIGVCYENGLSYSACRHNKNSPTITVYKHRPGDG